MREKGEEPIRVSSDLSDQREGGSIGKGTSPFSTAPHLESSNLPHSEEVSSEHHSSAPSVLRKGLKEGHAIFTEQRSSTTGGEGCSRTAIQDPPAAIVNRRTEPVRLREQEGAGSSPGEGRSWSRVVRGTTFPLEVFQSNNGRYCRPEERFSHVISFTVKEVNLLDLNSSPL